MMIRCFGVWMRLAGSLAESLPARSAASWPGVNYRGPESVAGPWWLRRRFAIMLMPGRFPRTIVRAWDRVRWPQPEVTAHA